MGGSAFKCHYLTQQNSSTRRWTNCWMTSTLGAQYRKPYWLIRIRHSICHTSSSEMPSSRCRPLFVWTVSMSTSISWRSALERATPYKSAPSYLYISWYCGKPAWVLIGTAVGTPCGIQNFCREAYPPVSIPSSSRFSFSDYFLSPGIYSSSRS